MHIYFITLQAETQKAFVAHLESFVRKYNPKRFEFAFDPEGAHKIYDYRILWKASSVEPISGEVGLDVIHLSDKGDLFHLLLNRKIDGLFYVTNSHFGDVYSEISQMRLLLPPQLLKQNKLTQGGVYFRDDVGSLLPEDLKTLSQTLKLPLYVETPQKVPHTCADIVHRLYQSNPRNKIPDLNTDQVDLPM